MDGFTACPTSGEGTAPSTNQASDCISNVRLKSHCVRGSDAPLPSPRIYRSAGSPPIGKSATGHISDIGGVKHVAILAASVMG